MSRAAPKTVGNTIAPMRFIFFALALAAAIPLARPIAADWFESVMIGFDAAAFLFLLGCIPLLATADPDDMRAHAAANDARRTLLLAITGVVMAVILLVIAKEVGARGPAQVMTLLIAWLFSNMVYALHYAHLSYREGQRAAGIAIPGTPEPTYGDFVYFAFTLGMTFQTSDVAIRDAGIRRTVTFHCLAAFIFNIGVLAFTINVIGGR